MIQVKILIVYDSKTGNTEKMAYAVAEGVNSTGVKAVLKKVEDISVDELPEHQGLILGSPVYYGYLAERLRNSLTRPLNTMEN